MLEFLKIRYKNFLATGNVWNEYQLDAHASTLIMGPNGAGKTTMLDALCFVLYGKPFRNINKPTVVNAINGKKMVVEVEFRTQNNHYMIRRGLKPTIFEIFCNNEPVPEFPSVTEMQEYLEKYILKCNFKAFTQVVILGAASYVPFMRLTPAARREILEDVLDIEVFSIMQTLMREKVTTVKEQLERAQQDVTLIETQLALVETYTNQWTAQQEAQRARIDVALQKVRTSLETLSATVLPNIDDHSWPTTYEPKRTEWHEKLNKARKIIAKLSGEIHQLQHSLGFFDKHDHCPTCDQIIDMTFKATKRQVMESRLGVVQKDLIDVEETVRVLEERIRLADESSHEWKQLKQEHRLRQDQRISLTEEQDRLERERQTTFNPPPAPPESIGDLSSAQQKVSTLTYKRHVYEQSLRLLKDTGIRTRIVQQYLPIINKWINHYLDALDFPIQFTLNDQFDESIKSRYRDEFSYEHFSEGEKRRIDLALLLTWRAVAQMKSSVHTNLLIFDEIFDSSLDATGVEVVMGLLNLFRETKTNIFVISPRPEVLIDRFASVITVTKERGFSVVHST